MLLQGYSLEIFKSKCQAEAKGVHCFAHLDNDIGEVLPYLNAVLGGFTFITDPPALTLKVHGKLITLHPRKIAINALRDQEEAEKIVSWLQREINQTWERRKEIEPSTAGADRPILLEVLKLLPRTNCRVCHEPTCLVFASRVVEGVRDHRDCPPMGEEEKQKLAAYLARFRFD